MKPATKSRVEKFAENKYVIIIGILIALIGGVPGAIGSYKELFGEPHIIYTNQGKIQSHLMSKNGPDGISICLLGGMLNDGDKIFYPIKFELEITVNNVVYKGEAADLRFLINDLSVKKDFSVDSTMIDFQRVKTLERGQPVYGALLFMFHGVYIDFENIAAKYRLICTDFFDKKYSIPIAIESGRAKKGDLKNIYLPKMNFEIR